jgi:hypothetical protein
MIQNLSRLAFATLVFSVMALISCGTSRAQTVLGAFENDLTSPYVGVDWAINGGVTSTAFVGYGVSEGASALEFTKGGTWGDLMMLNGGNALAIDLVAHDSVEFDVSVPAGANGDGGNWLQVFVVVQGDGMGWAILPTSAAGPPVDGTVTKITADLSGVTLTNSSTWSQLIFINQGGDPDGSEIEMTIDNITLVSATASVLLGDCNLDDAVDFADIPAFIAVLQSGSFLDQADCNEDDVVNFSDIPDFIEILQGG